MLGSTHYDHASSSSSSSHIHSSALSAASSSSASSVEAPADAGLGAPLPCTPSKVSTPVYLRQHPKKYRLNTFETNQVSWSLESCPPLLSHPEQLQHRHPQHHHQQHQQQHYQRFGSHQPVTIKTEVFSGHPYSPSGSYACPYVNHSSPLSSYALPTVAPAAPSCGAPDPLMLSHEGKGYFCAPSASPMSTLQGPGDAGGPYVTMLSSYNSPNEGYFSSSLTPPGKSEPCLSPFYLTSPGGQVGSGSAEVTAVFPADSSFPPASYERPTSAGQTSVQGASEVKVGAASATQVRLSHCPERELSLYKNKMESKLCDVCEDTAAGFHCGAFVCEACKKFFIRSWKADNNQRYQCTKSEACKITKDTRTHCQRCRYKKCIELRMVPPNMRPTETPDISAIPCRVCGAQSSGFHFGAITCEGCKGFFRRTIHERSNHSYTCSKARKCAINVQTRNNCKACRFVKCLDVGMSKTGSRIGRQPNAIKHLCGEEIRAQQKQQHPPVPPAMTDGQRLQQQQQQAMNVMTSHQPTDVLTPVTFIPRSQRQPRSTTQMGFTAPEEVSSSAPVDTPASLPDVVLTSSTGSPELIVAETLPSNAWSLSEFRELVVNAWDKRFVDVGEYGDVRVVQLTDEMNMKEVQNNMMERFKVHTWQLVNFAKRSPDFYVLPHPYQRMLVREAIYSFTLIQLSVDYNLERSEYNYFDFTEHERSIILKYFPTYKVICQHLRESGRLIKLCALDRVELAMLSYIEFIRGDFTCPPGQEQTSRANAIFERLESKATAALHEYIECHRPSSVLRESTLEQIHLTLVRMNREHFEEVCKLSDVARNSFSDLFNAVFRLSNPSSEREESAVGEADSTTTYRDCYSLPRSAAPPEVSTTGNDDLFL